MTNRLIVDSEFQALIPPLSGEERAGLEADLLRNGCLDALKVWRREDGDVLLDGYNRREICKRLGIPFHVEPVPVVLDRESAIRWMVNHQRHRRNLNEAQRAMLAALLASLENGQRKSASPIGEATQAEVAKQFHVGKRSVERARKVQQNGIPELDRLVTAGAVSVSAAADVATLPVEEQCRIVSAGAEAVAAAAGEIRHNKRAACAGKVSRPVSAEDGAAGNSAPLSSQHVVAPVLVVSAGNLLPCAHCRSEAEFSEEFDIMHGSLHALVCQNNDCGMQTPLRGDQDEVRNIWNRRLAPGGAMSIGAKQKHDVREEN